jgi:hypothetical protein
MEQGDSGAAERRRVRPGAGFWWGVVAVALAVAVVRVGAGGAAGAPARQDDAAAQATATREAELAELAALQTQVADLQTQVAEACAEPTATPEPTPVPPAPAGQPVTYAGDWTVVVGAATPRPTIETATAKGIFLELALTVTNNSGQARTFPFYDLVLIDAQGRTFVVDPAATTLFDVDWGTPINPSLPSELHLVFDVAADAGERFVLESKSDPTFRVEVALGGRG